MRRLDVKIRWSFWLPLLIPRRRKAQPISSTFGRPVISLRWHCMIRELRKPFASLQLTTYLSSIEQQTRPPVFVDSTISPQPRSSLGASCRDVGTGTLSLRQVVPFSKPTELGQSCSFPGKPRSRTEWVESEQISVSIPKSSDHLAYGRVLVHHRAFSLFHVQIASLLF
ncbi:hypothetical protein GGR53DRAFT_442956 [Hypoxylon sp. FL1150]|nr:hypothetical protein GGR53DRAFT_442956 [Hypoxylon sp. FL1150]